jgi:hypothetical protein
LFLLGLELIGSIADGAGSGREKLPDYALQSLQLFKKQGRAALIRPAPVIIVDAFSRPGVAYWLSRP